MGGIPCPPRPVGTTINMIIACLLIIFQANPHPAKYKVLEQCLPDIVPTAWENTSNLMGLIYFLSAPHMALARETHGTVGIPSILLPDLHLPQGNN